jgi:hypothetical protein
MKIFRRRKKKLNTNDYTKRWKEIQGLCASRKTWPEALQEADKLVDKALKQKRYKGKTTGERLVAAQHDLSTNDAIWFSHKYCNKVTEVDVRKLKKKDMLDALSGFREALRDLGALER